MITVVSGLPRSGTSLMMQMLAAGGMPVLTDGLRRADEDNPRGYFEFEPVKQLKEDPSWLETAEGKAVKMVYLLLYDLPPEREYRVIFMKRNLREVIASQTTMLAREGKSGGALRDDVLEKAFARQLEDVEAWLSAQKNFSSLHVSYNDLLRSPESHAKEIARFLSVPSLDIAAMGGAVEPSLHRQRDRGTSGYGPAGYRHTEYESHPRSPIDPGASVSEPQGDPGGPGGSGGGPPRKA